MARPREFDADAVLEAAVHCFWAHGYEATSIKDLVERTGITAASLYNVYGDKRALFRAALDHYVDTSIAERIRRCEALPPLEAINAFFQDILKRSLNDPEHKGCMLVNTALELAPHDLEFKTVVAGTLDRIENFFLQCVEKGRAEGTITSGMPVETLARHFLGVLMGIRVLARARPERAMLEGVLAPALAMLTAGTRS